LPDQSLKANALAFAPDTGILAVGLAVGDVEFWDLPKNAEVAKLTLPFVSQLAYAPDGRTLATAQGDSSIKLWDTATNKERAVLFAAPRGKALALAFSASGQMLATGDDQGEVRVFDPTELGRERIGPFAPAVTGEFMALSPAGKPVIASSTDLRLKSLDQGREEPFLSMQGVPIHAVAFAPDGQSLLLGGDNAAVRICDLAAHKELFELGRHETAVANGGSIQCLAVAPDGLTAASGSRDGMVYLWNLDKKTMRTRLSAHTDPPASSVTAVAFSPDGQTLATTSRDKKIKLWNVTGGGLKPRVLEGSPASLTSLAWSADGKSLTAGADDGVIRVWDVATLKLQSSLSGHSAAVSALAVHPETGQIVSSGLDGRILFHEPNSAKPVREWNLPEPVQAMSMSVEGRYLVTCSNGNVLLFRLAATR
jgi:WD40 repeat protein